MGTIPERMSLYYIEEPSGSLTLLLCLPSNREIVLMKVCAADTALIEEIKREVPEYPE